MGLGKYATLIYLSGFWFPIFDARTSLIPINFHQFKHCESFMHPQILAGSVVNECCLISFTLLITLNEAMQMNAT